MVDIVNGLGRLYGHGIAEWGKLHVDKRAR
jgi:hypothetical protein